MRCKAKIDGKQCFKISGHDDPHEEDGGLKWTDDPSYGSKEVYHGPALQELADWVTKILGLGEDVRIRGVTIRAQVGKPIEIDLDSFVMPDKGGER